MSNRSDKLRKVQNSSETSHPTHLHSSLTTLTWFDKATIFGNLVYFTVQRRIFCGFCANGSGNNIPNFLSAFSSSPIMSVALLASRHRKCCGVNKIDGVSYSNSNRKLKRVSHALKLKCPSCAASRLHNIYLVVYSPRRISHIKFTLTHAVVPVRVSNLLLLTRNYWNQYQNGADTKTTKIKCFEPTSAQVKSRRAENIIVK